MRLLCGCCCSCWFVGVGRESISGGEEEGRELTDCCTLLVVVVVNEKTTLQRLAVSWRVERLVGLTVGRRIVRTLVE